MIGQIDQNSVRPSFPNTSGWHIETSTAETNGGVGLVGKGHAAGQPFKKNSRIEARGG